MGIANFLRCILFYFIPSMQRTDITELRRILVVRNDHIGDVCLSLPFMILLKQVLSETVLSVLVHEYTEDIVSENPFIDTVIGQRNNDTVQDILKKLGTYDALFNLCSTEFNAQLCSRINARYKVGFGYKPYNMFTYNRFSFVKRTDPPVHETDFCFSFAEILGINTDQYREKAVEQTRIHYSDRVRESVNVYMKGLALDSSKPVIAIHPGDSRSGLNLNIQQYADIGGRLLGRGITNIVYTLGPSEKDRISLYPGFVREQCTFIPGDLSLKEFAVFLSQCGCLVSGSTGPMHIAGIMGTPTVSIFSEKPAHTPNKWHPIKNSHVIITPEEPYDSSSEQTYMETVDLDRIADEVCNIINPYRH